MLGAVLFDLAPVLFDRISPIRLQGGAGTDQSEYRLAKSSPESNTGVPEAKFRRITARRGTFPLQLAPFRSCA